MANHMQIPSMSGRETLESGKGSWEVQQTIGPQLFIDWVLTRKEGESFFFLLSSALVFGQENSLSSLSTLCKCGFYLSEMSLMKDGIQGSAKLAKLQVVILAPNALVSKLPHLHIFINICSLVEQRTVTGIFYSLPGNWIFFPLREFCKD